jgi:hypothetical protein
VPETALAASELLLRRQQHDRHDPPMALRLICVTLLSQLLAWTLLRAKSKRPSRSTSWFCAIGATAGGKKDR